MTRRRSSQAPYALIVGAGPGIGLSVARRFAREGWDIAILARTDDTLRTVSQALTTTDASITTLTADVTDESGFRSALDVACERLGTPDLVVYNAAIVQPDRVGELSGQDHLDAWAVNVVGALTTAAHLVPSMVARGSGSFIVTGGMPEAKPDYVSLSLGKAGLRTAVDLLAKQFEGSGIHVATVIVDGPVAAGTFFDPDAIAENYWHLHLQSPSEWDREILYTDGGPS